MRCRLQLGNKGFGEPLSFDNAYFVSLLRKPWDDKSDPMGPMIGLQSDHVLPDDPTCRPLIQRYAGDQAAFHADFAAAYLKLTSLGARWT
jgi:L-ascorbate peroxidase